MPDFIMTSEEAETLAWIHSNKFITTKIFHEKFRPKNSFQTACNDLERLEKEKGFLFKKKSFKNADAFYFCTRGTINQLRSLGLVLTSPSVRAPHSNTYNKEHDKRLLKIRMKFEADQALPGLTWVAEYELSIGYNMEFRKALNERRYRDLEKVQIRKPSGKVPDGLFETKLNERNWTFVVEYEHKPYSNQTVNRVYQRTLKSYSKEVKLFITELPRGVPRLSKAFGSLVKDKNDRAGWWFTDYETFMARPFLETPWVDLDDYHPALIAPNI